MRVRLASLGDRDGVYEVCRLTGDAGGDATGMYDDDDLLGDVYAGPYLALEPGLALVLVDGAQATKSGGEDVTGYALGALDTTAFVAEWQRRWLPALASGRPEMRDAAADMAATDGIATATDGAAIASDRLRHLLHHPELTSILGTCCCGSRLEVSAWWEAEAEASAAPPGDGDVEFGESGVDEYGGVGA